MRQKSQDIRCALDISQMRAMPLLRFSKAYNLSRQTVWRMCRDGRLKYVELTPGRKLILLDGVETVVNPPPPRPGKIKAEILADADDDQVPEMRSGS